MSDSKPLSQTNPHSRSLTPRQEYTPSPPRRSPPRQKRYRSRSPDHSPPRKYSRRSPAPSRPPSRDRDHRYHPYHRHDPNQSRDRFHAYDRQHRHHPSDRSHRYDRYDRADRSDRSNRSDRRDSRDPYPPRDQESRRRYYSPQPRSSPQRFRPPSLERRLSHDPYPYRPVHQDEAYRDRYYHHPRTRLSDRSSSRSPRHRRERRRRDRRRRDRQPVSPSQRMPPEEVDELFLQALKLVLKYRRPPFNISVISDYMSSINQHWSVRKTQYQTFSDLCRVQESRGHLALARQGESVVLHSSKYQPDVLEVRPKDIGRKKRNRDRDRAGGDAIHVDRTSRRDWDLHARAEARKERFRESGDKKSIKKTSEQELSSSKQQDIAKGPTQAAPESSTGKQLDPGPTEGATDGAERSTKADANGLEGAGATATSKTDQGGSVQPHSPETGAEANDRKNGSRKPEAGIEKMEMADKRSLGCTPTSSSDQKDVVSKVVQSGVSGKTAGGRRDKKEGKCSEAVGKGTDRMPNSAVDVPIEQ